MSDIKAVVILDQRQGEVSEHDYPLINISLQIALKVARILRKVIGVQYSPNWQDGRARVLLSTDDPCQILFGAYFEITSHKMYFEEDQKGQPISIDQIVQMIQNS